MKAFAMLTTVVLVVIAVGVSLVNGLPNLQPARTYGSQSLRFEAAFPTGVAGRLEGSLPVPGLALYAAGPYASGTTLAIMGVDPSALSGRGTNNNGGAYFYTTYFPIQPGPTITHLARGLQDRP
jgi:energy-converting hydrogenase Eha subunit A